MLPFVSLIIYPLDVNAQTVDLPHLHNQTLDAITRQTSLSSDPQIKLDAFSGGGPFLEINEGANKVYVAYPSDDKVAIIDGNTNTRIKDVPVGNGPTDIAINNATNTVYVANSFSGDVSVIDGKTNSFVKNISIAENLRSLSDIISINENFNTVYVVNDVSNSVSLISGVNHTKIRDIPVEGVPSSVYAFGYVYVSIHNFSSVALNNTGSVSIIGSIIDRNSRGTDIRNISTISCCPESMVESGFNSYGDSVYVADGNFVTGILDPGTLDFKSLSIPVGVGESKVTHIAVADTSDSHSPEVPADTIYVAKLGSDTISVYHTNISEGNFTIGEEIPIGGQVYDMAVYESKNMIYVTKPDHDEVVVIYGEGNDTKIKDINLGDEPTDIAINELTNTVYVLNEGSSGISVIDAETNEVVAGIRVNINPNNSGNIVCNESLNSPLNQSFYVPSGTKCTANAAKGYEFLNWVENLDNNSTRIILRSNGTSLLDSILDFFGYKQNDPAATLNVTQFGSFTANFQRLPNPLPPEYWGILFSVSISAIVGWSIPSIVGWVKAKRMGRTSNSYHKNIRFLYNDGSLDHADISSLNKIRNDLSDTYSKGKISEQHYQNLKGEIGVLYEEIHRKRINCLNDHPIKHNSKDDRLLTTIKQEIDDDFAKGKISEQHYNLLNKRIESFTNTNNETSDKTKRSPL